MSFVTPVWSSSDNHYVIGIVPAFSFSLNAPVIKDSNGNTVFNDMDNLESLTDMIIHGLIEEGNEGKWFTKLPSHDQLMKRVRHTFKSLASDSDNMANPTTLLLTPKQVTIVWTPTTVKKETPQISFDDSDSEASSQGDEVEVPESNLPAVELTDDSKETQEEYLLTRLRAAKARVEAEQIRMQYFETTGRMPPDSDSEDE
jgi:hypothetical protein